MERNCPECGVLVSDGSSVLREENAKLRAERDTLNLQFEEARKIIAEVSYSPEFKKWHYHGKEQDPCGVHAFTAKYAEKPESVGPAGHDAGMGGNYPATDKRNDERPTAGDTDALRAYKKRNIFGGTSE